MIPYGKHWLDEDDIQAVVEVLRSDWLTQGPRIEEFEEALAGYCGARYAVAVSSGTAALHLACLSAGLGKDDILWTSPNTFVASANCALYCGANPDFVDIDLDTYNISFDKLKVKLEMAEKSGKLPKIVVPVHFAGQSCEMEKIFEFSAKYNFKIIEDACHALGGGYKDFKIGSCKFSDMTVFSFHPVKHITTGEGGAVLTNNEKFYEKLLLFRNHGITKDPEKFTNKDLAFSQNPESLIHNPWYYEMQELGFNHRITDIQCALGISQLRKLDSFVSRRREIASAYNDAFKNITYIKIPTQHEDRKSAWHLYVVQIDFGRINKSRASVMNALREKGIGAHVHYIPVYLQPFYRNKLGYKEGACSMAESYYRMALSLPIYPRMKNEDVNKVINSVKDCLNVR